MIREAVRKDAAPLAELAARTFQLACPPGSSEHDIALHLKRNLSEERFGEYLADGSIAIMVVERDAQLLGYTLLIDRPTPDAVVRRALTCAPTVEVSKCYVHPTHHGSGMAEELMKASVQWAGTRGAASLWLAVNSENGRAIRFYEKSGFTKVGSRNFVLGTAHERDYVLERVLP